MGKQTCLYDRHTALGGRVVDFAGWEMPVQYSGILDEHRAVREAVGVFDISHMGEFFVSGPGATAWLDGLLTNRVEKLTVGEAQYTLLCNERGGVIDDLIVYRLADEEYLLIVNAAKIDEDAAWLRAHAAVGVDFQDRSGEFAALAVQGPLARGVFETVFGEALATDRNRVATQTFNGTEVFVVTTGYTGEDGFEVVVPEAAAGELWDALIAAGAKPCGLGARDTLRLEMGYPLNGSDLSPDHTPLEAGLGFFVDLNKDGFIGRSVLAAQKEAGLTTRLAAIAVTEKSPPIRPHYPVWVDGVVVGETSSGALSPSLGRGIAMAYLPAYAAKVGHAVEIEVRGKRYPGNVVRKPFSSVINPMNVPDDLKYAESHEWIRVADGIGTVGITDHAQAELTDIVFVEPPKVGVTFAARNAVAVVESVKAASDIYTPVSGEVVEVNPALDGEPALLNTDPFDGGWIFKIKLSDPGELDALKTPEDYRAQIAG